jgi:molybdenum cofactor biosynthesis enzyme MoaA
LFLTMVLPAPNGCNLKCPFCVISQRGESTPVLTGDDYAHFIADSVSHFPITDLSIQGYEPLLAESWILTKHILETADTFSLGTRLVTNGTRLSLYAEELSGLVDVVTISLDSHRKEIHEKLRGVSGCFDQTIAGIREAVKYFGPDHVVIASVLFPGKQKYLTRMPKLLTDIGVKRWEIGLYTNFRNGTSLSNTEWIKDTLCALEQAGGTHGVELSLSDELRRLESTGLYRDVHMSTLKRDIYVVRLSPDATSTRRQEKMRPSIHAPVWDRVELPNVFLKRILKELGVKIQPK